jgi:uncharacterized membrane protein YidH (DUF202 family)
MKNILTSPRSSAILGFILALPFMTILSLMMLRIEPSLGPLEPWLNRPNPGQPNLLGTLMVLGAFMLSILGGIVVRAPVVRTVRAGGSLLAHPIHLLLAAAILVFIALFVGIIIVDQYPCWTGVPNCD